MKRKLRKNQHLDYSLRNYLLFKTNFCATRIIIIKNLFVNNLIGLRSSTRRMRTVASHVTKALTLIATHSVGSSAHPAARLRHTGRTLLQLLLVLLELLLLVLLELLLLVLLELLLL